MIEAPSITADQLRHVLDVSRALVVTADLEQLLTKIARAATMLLAAERASLFLHDPEKKQLWTKVALGAKEIRVPEDAGIVGHVFKTDTLLNIPDAYADARFNRAVDKATGFTTRNLLTIPLPDIEGRPLGVLQVINKVGSPFLANDEEMIGMLAAQAGVAIQRYRLQQAAVETVALKREMELAKRVQQRLIPQSPPGVAGYEAVGWALAASTTGGDCYDLWKMHDGQLGVFLGDASGHGLAPALVVSQTRTLMRALSEVNCNPHWLLSKINARLVCDLDPDRFVTAFAACINADGVMNWWSAGQGGVFVRTRPGEPLVELEPCAPPLGVIDDFGDMGPTPYRLEVGGQLIVMSDGIFEAPRADCLTAKVRPNGSLFGVPRVWELLDQCQHNTPSEIISRIRTEVQRWQGQEEPEDDQTIVVVQRMA